MKKLLIALTLGLALSFTFSGQVEAGEAVSLGDAVLVSGDPTEQFDPVVFGVKPQYAFLGDSHEDTYGVEASVGYYFSKYCGVQLAAGYIDTDSAIQNYTVDVIAKYPAENFLFNTVGFEPYAILGTGVYTNSETAWLTRAGLGVNLQVVPLNGTVLFVEGVYNFVNDLEDYSTVGAGIKFSF